MWDVRCGMWDIVQYKYLFILVICNTIYCCVPLAFSGKNIKYKKYAFYTVYVTCSYFIHLLIKLINKYIIYLTIYDINNEYIEDIIFSIFDIYIFGFTNIILT
jgi:hypothetical protein